MAKEPGQTNFNMGGLNYDINPATGQYEQLPAHMTGFGSPYADPTFQSNLSKISGGAVTKSMPNISPYTGGVSASNPFPSSMTNYGSGGRTAPFAFNEAYYQYQNPDVAAAVASGQFPSGYAHYQQYGQNEGRAYSPTSSQFNADPNRIPYGGTTMNQANPYLNFDMNRAYAIPAPIMNGTWNNLTQPTNIWKPTSYVNQVDQARENAARSDLYNPATPTTDTSPNTSINTAPVHGNTAGWQRSDTDATLAPAAGMADAPSAYFGASPTGWDSKFGQHLRRMQQSSFSPMSDMDAINRYVSGFGYEGLNDPRMQQVLQNSNSQYDYVGSKLQELGLGWQLPGGGLGETYSMGSAPIQNTGTDSKGFPRYSPIRRQSIW